MCTHSPRSQILTEQLSIVDTDVDYATRLISLSDDPNLPIWTFRMWFLSIGLSCFGAVLGQIFVSKSCIMDLVEYSCFSTVFSPTASFSQSTLPSGTFSFENSIHLAHSFQIISYVMGKVWIHFRSLGRYQSLSRCWKRSFLDQGRTPYSRLLIPAFGGRKIRVSCPNQMGDTSSFRFMNPGYFSEIPSTRPQSLSDPNLKTSKSTSPLPLWPRRHHRPLLLLASLRRKTCTTTSDLTQRLVFSGSFISLRSEGVSLTPLLKFARLSTNWLQCRW